MRRLCNVLKILKPVVVKYVIEFQIATGNIMFANRFDYFSTDPAAQKVCSFRPEFGPDGRRNGQTFQNVKKKMEPVVVKYVLVFHITK